MYCLRLWKHVELKQPRRFEEFEPTDAKGFSVSNNKQAGVLTSRHVMIRFNLIRFHLIRFNLIRLSCGQDVIWRGKKKTIHLEFSILIS